MAAEVKNKDASQIKQHQAMSKQHQAVHGHMRYLVSAVGRLDLQSCMPHIAASNSLKKRLALYRWALNEFKKALQHDMEQDKQAFFSSPSLDDILQVNQELLLQINRSLKLVESALNANMLREELNVILVKTNLATNTICETIELKMLKEDTLVKIA